LFFRNYFDEILADVVNVRPFTVARITLGAALGGGFFSMKLLEND